MTDGERLIWATTYAVAFNENIPRREDAEPVPWEFYHFEVQHAALLSIERATLAVLALKEAVKKAADECRPESALMVAEMLGRG